MSPAGKMLNVKGLNVVPEKHRMLLQDLKQSHSDVAYIQETHFKEGKAPTLKNSLHPFVYHAFNRTSKSRGVSILISRQSLRDIRADKEGRFLFLKGTIGGIKVTLATVNVPNCNQDQFICSTINRLMKFAEGKLLLGRDFNLALEPKVDTSIGNSSVTMGRRK